MTITMLIHQISFHHKVSLCQSPINKYPGKVLLVQISQAKSNRIKDSFVFLTGREKYNNSNQPITALIIKIVVLEGIVINQKFE